MNTNDSNQLPELPPWTSLPKEVRERATERYREMYGHRASEDAEIGLEESKSDLADLSKFRLVKLCGSIRKAMAFAKKHDYETGPHRRKDWEEACERARQKILVFTDPGTREHLIGQRVQEIVREELARWTKENL